MSVVQPKEATGQDSDAVTSWESSVAGVNDQPVDPLDDTLREVAAHLKARIRNQDWDSVKMLAQSFVSKTDSKGARLFTRERLLTMARFYGGPRTLFTDLSKNPDQIFHKAVLPEVRRMLGLEPLQTELDRFDFIERGKIAQEINTRVLRPAAEGVTGTFVFKLLTRLKKWNKETANSLADDGHVVLATLLATVDFFIPETGFDVALSVVPISGGGLIVSRLGQSFARRFPRLGTFFEKLGKALTKDLTPEIRALFNRASKGDSKALNALAYLDEYAAGQPMFPSKELTIVTPDTLKPVRVLKGEGAAKVLPPSPRELLAGQRGLSPLAAGDKAAFDAVLKKMSARFAALCKSELRPTGPNAPVVEWIEKANGEIVQVITGPIARRAGGRQDLVGLESRHGFVRAHLIPDVLGGDPRRYNLVYTPQRLNTSLMGQVDQLVKEDIKDATLRIEITFENWERAWKRWPKPGMDAFKYTFRRPSHKPSRLDLPWVYTDADILKIGQINAAMRKMMANAKRYGAQASQHGGPKALEKMMKRLDETGRVETAFD